MKVSFFLERKSEIKFVSRFINKLIDDHEVSILTLDDSLDIPVQWKTKVKALHFKSKINAAFRFRFLDCDILFSTAPYLGNGFFQKSIKKSIHYSHIVHSLISCHVSYKPGAFDKFDSVLICSPHHWVELDHMHKEKKIKPSVIPFGYQPFEDLKNSKEEKVQNSVVIAPTWNGPLANIDVIDKIIETYLSSGWEATFRPHELFLKQMSSSQINSWKETKGLNLVTSNSSEKDLLKSKIMICDYSGIAYEYSFSLNKPVLFYTDPHHFYECSINLEKNPIEMVWRDLVGQIFEYDEIQKLPEISKLLSDSFEGLSKGENTFVYNLEKNIEILTERLKSMDLTL